jgi:hypothetical protein
MPGSLYPALHHTTEAELSRRGGRMSEAGRRRLEAEE